MTADEGPSGIVHRTRASTAAAARRFVRDALAADGLDPILPDAELLVSELVTNALLHTDDDDPLVEVLVEPGGATVRVYDDDPTVEPAPRRVDPTSTDGRGLLIVSTIATTWGSEPADHGKVVWFQLDLPAPT